ASPVSSLDSSDAHNAPSEQMNNSTADDEWIYKANDFAVSTTGTWAKHSKTPNDQFTVSEHPAEKAYNSRMRFATPLDEVSQVASLSDRFGFIINAFCQDIYQDSSRRFGCRKCGKTFGRQQEAKRHTKNSLSCGNARSFRCPKCKLLFTRADAVARHVKGLDGIPPTCKKNAGPI
ncbi:hypothetical protein PILCRDRAFT_825847, partial [Piloderma croceum F 1598]